MINESKKKMKIQSVAKLQMDSHVNKPTKFNYEKNRKKKKIKLKVLNNTNAIRS